MNFARQLVHFVRFDLQRTVWWWTAYLMLLLLTSLVFFGQPLYEYVPTATTWALPLLTWLVAMGLAITTVQGDSPLSVTAFWHGKPVEGRAIGYAKLLTFTLVVASTCAVALLVWRLTGMPVDVVRESLQRGAPSLLRLVMVAAVFGAVTRSFGTALLLLVAVVVMLLVLGPLALLATGASGAISRVSLPTWKSFSGVTLLTLLIVVVVAYQWNRLRGVRPAKLIAAMMLLAAVSLTAQLGEWSRGFGGSKPRTSRYSNTVLVTADGPSSMPETIRFESVPHINPTGVAIGYEVVGARADRRYELRYVWLRHAEPAYTVSGADSTHRYLIANRFNGQEIPHRPLMAPTSAFSLSPEWRWRELSPATLASSPRRGLLSGSLRITPAGSVDSVRIEGTAIRYRAVEVARVPFAPGAVYADTFASIHLRRDAQGDVALVWTSYGAADDDDPLATGGAPLDRHYAFAVLDSARRTAYRLTSSSTASYPELLVLPGAYRRVHEHMLDEQSVMRALLAQRSASPATLIVYRWVEDGRRRVHQVYPADGWPRGDGEAGPTVLIRE